MAFETWIGNEEVKKLLQTTVKTKNIVQSYLFRGTQGIGKRSIAKEFAKMILCEKESDCPCGTCKSCLEYEGRNHPDFKMIEQEDSIKIEQIRQMQNKVMEKPITSARKVYIINQADRMTKEAQNCLLKTLEEPPEYMTIILITENENDILQTIQSRCMKVVFQRIETPILLKFLQEKYKIDNLSESMLEMVDGSIGRALLLREKQGLYTKVEQLIQTIEQNSLIELWDRNGILYKEKEEIYTMLDYMNVVFYQLAKEKPKKANQYTKAIGIIEETKRHLKANSNYDMSIDSLLLQIGEELK